MEKECSLQLAVSANASRERKEGGGSLAEDPNPLERDNCQRSLDVGGGRGGNITDLDNLQMNPVLASWAAG